MIYLLDTNVISDRIVGIKAVTERLFRAVADDHTVYLPQPVVFEVQRGLLKVNATRKLKIFDEQIVPLLEPQQVEERDWRQAAQMWADTRNAGRQLSDVDLLLAAMTLRLDAVLVSADNDFDALPIQRVDWRTPNDTQDR